MKKILCVRKYSPQNDSIFSERHLVGCWMQYELTSIFTQGEVFLCGLFSFPITLFLTCLGIPFIYFYKRIQINLLWMRMRVPGLWKNLRFVKKIQNGYKIIWVCKTNLPEIALEVGIFLSFTSFQYHPNPNSFMQTE